MNIKNIFENTNLVSLDFNNKAALNIILKIRNEKKVRENMINHDLISEKEHFRWTQEQKFNKDKKIYLILYKEKIQGSAILNLCDNKNSWAFYISEKTQKGVGACVEFIFLDKYFSEHSFSSIFCEVLSFNIPVLNLHSKFGFKEIDTKIQFLKRKSLFHNLICIKHNRQEWLKEKEVISKKLRLV